MARVSRRMVGLFLALTLVSAGVVAGSALAAKKKDTVDITVAPTTGKYGTKYNVNVKGKAGTTGEELALSMTSAPGSCPTDYSAGFASLSGIANAKGKPVAPKYVKGELQGERPRQDHDQHAGHVRDLRVHHLGQRDEGARRFPPHDHAVAPRSDAGMRELRPGI